MPQRRDRLTGPRASWGNRQYRDDRTAAAPAAGRKDPASGHALPTHLSCCP
jgi:hypothetical protein